MRRNSGNISIIIGAVILFLVAFGLSGIAYSFYRAETTTEQEESEDTAEENSPFEQLERETNMVITPVPEELGGSGSIELEQEGIPTGTYSNPLANINPSGGSAYIPTSPDSAIIPEDSDNFDNSVSSSSDSLTDGVIDYDRPSYSNNFKSTDDNSLVDPLEEDNFLEAPSSSTYESPTTETLPLTESQF